MSIPSTSLNGTTLPSPSEYETVEEYRGGTTILSNGDMRRDLVDTTGRKLFRFTWYAATSSELTTIRTAYAAATLGGVALVAPDGNTYLVNADERAIINAIGIKSGGALRYRTTLTLREAYTV